MNENWNIAEGFENSYDKGGDFDVNVIMRSKTCSRLIASLFVMLISSDSFRLGNNLSSLIVTPPYF